MTNDILPLLIAERDRLNRALEALQGAVKRRGRPPKNPLSASPATDIPKLRRGRPPKNPLAALAPTAPAPPRKGMSTAARKALSERMKKYWAKRRKAA